VTYLSRNVFTLKIKHILFFSFFFFFLLFACLIFLLKAPDLLVVKSSLVKSDIVFVLGGVARDRLPVAVKLLKDGWAEKIIIPTPQPSDVELEFYKTYGDQFSEESIIRCIVKKQKVPGTKLAVLKGFRNTFEEIMALRQEYNRKPFKSAILVTHPLHTRRVILLTKRIFRSKNVIFNIYYPSEWKDYSILYNEKRDYFLETLNEYVKNIYYFLFLRAQT